MDLIYKIYSIYLYDNQLNHDYLIFFNKKNSWDGGYSLGYDHSRALDEIYQQKTVMNKLEFEEFSINRMKNASKSPLLLPANSYNMVKNDDFLTLVKTGETHLPNYNIYNIYWNETKSGINPHDYEVMATWNIGSSQYSTYRIWEEKEERKRVIRDTMINMVLI